MNIDAKSKVLCKKNACDIIENEGKAESIRDFFLEVEFENNHLFAAVE